MTKAATKTTLAEVGHALIDHGYDILSIKPGTKRPSDYEWKSIRANHATVDSWLRGRRGHWGVGILGKRTPAIDLDISDAAVLEKVMEWCRREGLAVGERVGRPPRVLLPCYAEVAFPKLMSSVFTDQDGTPHAIEVLADGQQWIAYAVHPETGQPYSWTGADPFTTPAELLPTLTREKALELIEFFESIAPPEWTEKKSSRNTNDGARPTKTNLSAALSDVASAMAALANADLHYDDWVNIGMALRGAVGEHEHEGRELWHEFSQQSAKYDFEVADARWTSFAPKTIGAGTLFRLAMETGWRRPKPDAADEFDAADIDIGVSPFARPPAAAKSDRWVFETVTDLRKLPPARWLVKGWIPENATGILYGKYGSGKTFVGFDLALSLAYGLEYWHGAKLPGEPCRVLVIAREGQAGFTARVDAWKRHHNIDVDPPGLEFMRMPISFAKEADFEAFAAALKARGGYRLILVDTVGRVLPGVDMSTAESVTTFMDRCQKLTDATGAATIGVHHSNKSGGMYGSVYFGAHADFVFEVKRTGAEDQPLRRGEIFCEKMKDGDDRWRRYLAYDEVQTDDDPLEPASSLVLSAVLGAPVAGQGAEAAWQAIHDAHELGTPWSQYARSRSTGRYAAANLSRQLGIDEPAAAKLVAGLLAEGQVEERMNAKTKVKYLAPVAITYESEADGSEE